MGRAYTGDLGEREMLKNFILSKRAVEAYHLCSGTANYVGGGKKIEGNNMQDKRNK